MIVQVFEWGDLWDVYGIVGDVVVHSHSPGNLVSLTFIDISHSTAVHQQLSKGQHKWTFITRHSSPAYQRNIQRPPSSMDQQLYHKHKHKEGGEYYIGRYWLKVWLDLMVPTPGYWLLLTESQLHPSLQVCASFTRVVVSNSGQVMTQRHWWRC